MDKAKELKKKTNLEVPASKKLSGIMRSNPFNLLQVDTLGCMANSVGVRIGNSILDSSIDDSEEVDELFRQGISNSTDATGREDVEVVDVEFDQVSNDSMEFPEQYNTAHDRYEVDEESWIRVCSKKWGKHPKKSFQC
jgi:hypothetical protein